jgi:glutamate N-acetyltransferase/amino-acid N-acetyltransferase
VAQKAAAKKALRNDEVIIEVDLGVGTDACTFWTSDLSCEYVDMNAKYTKVQRT